MYVPIIRLNIEPLKNGNRPGIESNHRPVSCPPYMKPLFEAKWGKAANVVEIEHVQADHVDTVWKVPQLPGRTVVDSEIDRLTKYFGEKTFKYVYRPGEFEAAFKKVATASNPNDARRAKRDEAVADQAVARAAKGVMDAATNAAIGADRKKRVRGISLKPASEPAGT